MNSESAEAGPPSIEGSAGSSSAGQVVALATALLAVPLIIVLCVIAALLPAVPWWLGIPIGALVAVAVVVVRRRRSAEIILAGLGASPAGVEEFPHLHNLVQGLSLAGGVAEPELHVIDDAGRNAAVVANGDRAAIVTTTGLLGALDRISLEGVVAEALVRIRSGDAEAATLGAAMFGGLLSGPLSAVAKPVATYGLRTLLADDRDLQADRAAVALTRYPPGLLSAFTEIRSGSARVGVADAANEYVWLVPPSTVEGAGSPPVEAASLDLRIDVLAEL